MSDKQLLLAFYGDDFTGSTDALEFISRAGMKAVLFIEPPSAEQLRHFKDLDAEEVAGMTRSLSPTDMEEVLTPAFERLKELQPKHVHYKVCSTFNSSPTVGSIGKAIDVAMEIFNSSIVPVLVAAPHLGRYSVFGNLFARMGIGSKGEIYRLDRHPSMSKHPVTPADDSDLVLHLGKQTKKKISLLDILQIAKPTDDLKGEWERLRKEGVEIAMIDALYDEQLLSIGKLLDNEADNTRTLFSVGSSGIEMALGKCWNEQGLIKPIAEWPAPGKAELLLVLSGSCSPVTEGQLSWALANGYKEVAVDAVKLIESEELIESYSAEALCLLQQGYDVIVHTDGGRSTNKNLTGKELGTALGKIGLEILKQIKVRRLVIAGGDTSSYAARALGVEAVEMIAPLVAGAPLCKAYSKDKIVDGLEINFKGGQVGGEDYYGVMKEGLKG